MRFRRPNVKAFSFIASTSERSSYSDILRSCTTTYCPTVTHTSVSQIPLISVDLVLRVLVLLQNRTLCCLRLSTLSTSAPATQRGVGWKKMCPWSTSLHFEICSLRCRWACFMYVVDACRWWKIRGRHSVATSCMFFSMSLSFFPTKTPVSAVLQFTQASISPAVQNSSQSFAVHETCERKPFLVVVTFYLCSEWVS